MMILILNYHIARTDGANLSLFVLNCQLQEGDIE